MLSSLSIRDVVLVEALDLDFGSGLCALTGETGAGKSILLDSLALALGRRSDAALVRQGAQRAFVLAAFDLPDGHPALALAEGNEIPVDGRRLELGRTVQSDGRTKAQINARPVPVALLRQFGSLLVEIHGQFDAQGLMDPASHREILDLWSGASDLASSASQAWREWRSALAEAEKAAAATAEAEREEEWLRHCVAELDDLAPEEGEEEALSARRAVLADASGILATLASIGELLEGEEGASRAASSASRLVSRAPAKAADLLAPVAEALERAQDQIAEAIAAVEAAAASIDGDPGEQERVEDRLHALRAAARKHKTTPDALAALRSELSAKLSLVDSGRSAAGEWSAKASSCKEIYVVVASALSEMREESKSRLDAAVQVELAPLRMPGCSFSAHVQRRGEDGWGPDGFDSVEFRVSTNPGSAPGPLHKIASGGELSRLMLAVKAVLAESSPAVALVFDEIDQGIGGAAAAAVGDRLAALSSRAQVLAVTHSPQVAARADAHLKVSKSVQDGGVRTDVAALDAAGRREEIARMLSAAEVTEEARSAAEALLRRRGADSSAEV